MRKRTLGVVLLAGLAMSGAGAFAAANDMTGVNGDNKNVAGYGEATVTGATVTKISYSPNATDPRKLDQVVFAITETNLGTKKATMVLRNIPATGSASIVGTYACTIGTAPADSPLLGLLGLAQGAPIVTCPTGTNPNIDAFNSVGLTIHQ